MVSNFWKRCLVITLNTLRPRQIADTFQTTFSNAFFYENVWISIKISLKFVPKGPINNFPVLVQTMARRRPGDKPLFEPMTVSLLAHICVTRPQWVKWNFRIFFFFFWGGGGGRFRHRLQGNVIGILISHTNCYAKTWRPLCPFFRNLHLRENLAKDCFTSTASTVTNSVQDIFTRLLYCDKWTVATLNNLV